MSKVALTEGEPVIRATALRKVYQRGREEVRALDGLDFEVLRGEFIAVVGPSGSGKTTLLNLLGCMDAPTSGRLVMNRQDLQTLTERERTQFRRDQIGFIFQHFSLLPTLTVEENVALPGLFAGRKSSDRVSALIERVGLGARRHHRPAELSGGEMQRAAIARALVNEPILLLADEPTGNLDSTTGQNITALFQQLNRDGLTIVVVTHQLPLAQAAGRQLVLQDGRLSTGVAVASSW